jgi:AcrR family transcriptional regulator
MRPTKSECKQRILSDVIPLFAEKGYGGVTMRKIAAKARITPGALYHHFSGKQDLYLSAMKQAFAGRAQLIMNALSIDAPAMERLRSLIDQLCAELSRDRVFTRLIHREILDGDQKRLRVVVDQVFRDVFSGLVILCRELAPSFDPFLLGISIISLTVHYYHIAGLRELLPGSWPEHDDPETVARHILRLLFEGIGSRRVDVSVEIHKGELST